MDNIVVAYIDDNVDNYLSRYLAEHFKSNYYEITFSNNQGYKDILEDKRIRDSNIVIVDSRLFENKNVNNKFSGEELGLMFNLTYPYIEVIVISQNDDSENYGILKKFNSNDVKDKNQNEYYDEKLLPMIDECKQKVIRKRRILEKMEKNTYEDEIVTKIQEIMNGNSTYRELSNDKIDKLIDLVNEALEINGNL